MGEKIDSFRDLPAWVAGVLSVLLGGIAWQMTGEIPEIDAAYLLLRSYQAADAWRQLHGSELLSVAVTPVPNPGVVAVWIGAWMAVLGKSPVVALLALGPFQVARMLGLWVGARALKTGPTGILVLLLGLVVPLWVGASHRIMLDLPFVGAFALALGGVLAGRDRLAVVGVSMGLVVKLAAGPGMAVIGLYGMIRAIRARQGWAIWLVPGLVGLVVYGPGIQEIVAYSAGNQNISPVWVGMGAAPARLVAHLSGTFQAAGPVLLGLLVWVLLKRPAPLSLTALALSLTYPLGISATTHTPQIRYDLPALTGLVMVAATGTPPIVVGAAALQAASCIIKVPWVPPGWTLAQAQDRTAMADTLQHLDALRPPAPRLRISVQLPEVTPLSVAAFQAAAAEQEVPLDFVAPSAGVEVDYSVYFEEKNGSTKATASWGWPGRGWIGVYEGSQKEP